VKKAFFRESKPLLGDSCSHRPRLLRSSASSSQPGLGGLIVTEDSAYTAAAGAHAIAILTEWDEFKSLDYQRIYDSMAKPAFIFDGRNIVDLDEMRKIGFDVYAIGKPTPPPF